MNMLDMLLNTQNGAAVHQLAAQFGLPPAQASAALSALVPALAAGIQRNLSAPGGPDTLQAALASGDHQRYLDDTSSLGDGATVAAGNGILGHLFGTKDVSRQVAQQASATTGIDASILKRMLPLVATMAMGGLSRHASASGGLTGAAASGGLMSMLGPLLNHGGDGSVMDDMFGAAGRFLGGRS